jgi:hypothetical protein
VLIKLQLGTTADETCRAFNTSGIIDELEAGAHCEGGCGNAREVGAPGATSHSGPAGWATPNALSDTR